MRGTSMTRKKWLSVTLGVGLAMASLGTASVSAQTSQGTNQQETQSTTSARQGYQEFLDRTARDWSEAGYSSAEHMRVAEGGDWYTELRAQYGPPLTGGEQVARDDIHHEAEVTDDLASTDKDDEKEAAEDSVAEDSDENEADDVADDGDEDEVDEADAGDTSDAVDDSTP